MATNSLDATSRAMERLRRMTDADRIKNALVNVSLLAQNSEYYNADRDLKDIELIESIVMKSIPEKPEYESDGDWNGEPVYDTWICPNCGKHYEVECDHYDFCPDCGQRIDWDMEEE